MCVLDFNMQHGNADIFGFEMKPYATDPRVIDMDGFRPELSVTLVVARAVSQGGVLYVSYLLIFLLLSFCLSGMRCGSDTYAY